MKIILSGGGTMGSVTPLLAITKELQNRGHEILFVGTKNGPEREVVEKQYDLRFVSIPAAKFRRYFTWRHLLTPFEFALAKKAAFTLLKTERPDVIVSAGGFVSVPLSWIGRICFKIPTVIHQQDIVPGLANRLMTPCAKVITVTFPSSQELFPTSRSRRVIWTGNPVRDLTPTTQTVQPLLDLSVPTVLITGGGTGAEGINNAVSTEICEFANVIHIAGKGKLRTDLQHPRYHQYEFMREELAEALSLASVVVSRAGIGSLTEIATMQKPSIIIPMPASHQEENARYMNEAEAACVLPQSELTPALLTEQIRALLHDSTRQKQYREGMQTLFPEGANEASVEAIESIVKT